MPTESPRNNKSTRLYLQEDLQQYNRDFNQETVKQISAIREKEISSRTNNNFRQCRAHKCMMSQKDMSEKTFWKSCKICRRAKAHSECVTSPTKTRSWICNECVQWNKKLTSPNGNEVAAKQSPSKATRDALISSAIHSTMKLSFCKGIDSHLNLKARGSTSLKHRKTDRSPFSLRQKDQVGPSSPQSSPQSAPSESSLPFLGKENTEKVMRRKRRPRSIKQPEFLFEKCATRQRLLSSKRNGTVSRRKKQRVKSTTKRVAPSKKSKNVAGAKMKKTTKIKLTSSVKPSFNSKDFEVKKSGSISTESSPAKKFVENSPRCMPSASICRNLNKAFTNASSTRAKAAKRSSCDSGSSKKAVKKMVKKVSIEPVPIEKRQLYHVKNNQPIEYGEFEAEEDYQWLVDASDRQIDEFLDLNDGEKRFFKLWNTHLHNYPCYGDRMMVIILEKFIEKQGGNIIKQNLYRNFVLHLSNLYDFAVISQENFKEMLTRLQMQWKQLKQSEEDVVLSKEQKCAYKSNVTYTAPPEVKIDPKDTEQEQRASMISKQHPMSGLIPKLSHLQEAFRELTPSSDSVHNDGTGTKLYLSESDTDSSVNSFGLFKANSDPRVAATLSLRLSPSSSSTSSSTSSSSASLKGKSKEVVYFAGDSQVNSSIKDIPSVLYGLCSSGTRYRAFVSPVCYVKRNSTSPRGKYGMDESRSSISPTFYGRRKRYLSEGQNISPTAISTPSIKRRRLKVQCSP